MRVLFASTRGSGHFNPLVPFIEACRRGGHEVLVVGPPALADAARGRGYAVVSGAAPPDDELGAVWGRVPSLSYEEAERLVIGEIFATLNVRAMLGAMRAAVRSWQPDVIVRETAEFASAIVADEAAVPHVQVAIGLAVSHAQITSMAQEAVEAWRRGLTDRIAATPYLTMFPASIEDPPGVANPPDTHRFRDPAAPTPSRPLADWWPGEEDPLVYMTFGSETAAVPPAAPIYDVALEAVAALEARVLLTTGHGMEDGRLSSPGPHVHIARWVAQADVLAHARAVVCHGGSGTTLGDLRDAIALVLADETYTRAAAGIASEIRELPPADDALAVLGGSA